MKTAKLILTIAILLPLTSRSQSKSTNMKTITTEEAKPTCKLTTKELQERKKTIVANLKNLMLGKVETNNGFKYKFDGSDKMLDLLNDFIKTERMCCDFFTFQITVEENIAWLELSGPTGTKDFIKQ